MKAVQAERLPAGLLNAAVPLSDPGVEQTEHPVSAERRWLEVRADQE